MLYDLIAFVLILTGGLVFYVALRKLFGPGWFMGWLRGTLNMLGLVAAAFVALMAWDVFSYDEFLEDVPIATISFEKLGEQHYHAVLVSTTGEEQHFELKGDQWQLDARIFRWNSMLAKAGFKPGYRLERLSGRYYSLDEERNGERTVYSLSNTYAHVDLWSWFKSIDKQVPWLDALYGSATFVPMRDGALYEINLSSSGLTAEPLNDRAQKAIKNWQ